MAKEVPGRENVNHALDRLGASGDHSERMLLLEKINALDAETQTLEKLGGKEFPRSGTGIYPQKEA